MVCRTVKAALRWSAVIITVHLTLDLKHWSLTEGRKRRRKRLAAELFALTSLEETPTFRPDHSCDTIRQTSSSLPSPDDWRGKNTRDISPVARGGRSLERGRPIGGAEPLTAALEPAGAQRVEQQEGLTPQDGMKRRRPSLCLPALQKLKCKHSQSLIFH